VHATVVFVEDEDEFSGVAEENEILEIDVRESDLLVAKREGIERAIGIFSRKLK